MLTSWLWWLVLGLLIGFLVEWVVDWIYWRPRYREVVTRLAELESASGRGRTQLADVQTSLTALAAERDKLAADAQAAAALAKQRGADLDRLQGALADMTAERNRLQAQLDTRGAAANDNTAALRAENARLKEQFAALRRMVRDPLIDINGIGPVYEQKLFAAGVYTFDDLAAMTPEQVRAIIQPEPWQDIDAAAWIAEARRRAGETSALPDSDRVAGTLASVMRVRNENARLRHHIATGTAPTAPPDLAGLRTENSRLADELARLRAELAQARAAVRDPLIDINGIGPVYEQKLFAAGVRTFAQLGEMTPEQVRAIIQPQPWQEFEPEKWIAEARQRAGLAAKEAQA
jgi:predicted flap endonuclease-1-like 5' DNA nuclease